MTIEKCVDNQQGQGVRICCVDSQSPLLKPGLQITTPSVSYKESLTINAKNPVEQFIYQHNFNNAKDDYNSRQQLWGKR